MEIKNYLPPLTELFREKDVLFAYLFGSSVHSKRGPMSDIDIAVYPHDFLEGESLLKCKIDLASALSLIFEEDAIDLVVLYEAPPLLKYEIITKGNLIYNADPDARIEFHRKTLNEYFDTQYIRDVNYRCILKRLKQGGLGEDTRGYFYED